MNFFVKNRAIVDPALIGVKWIMYIVLVANTAAGFWMSLEIANAVGIKGLAFVAITGMFAISMALTKSIPSIDRIINPIRMRLLIADNSIDDSNELTAMYAEDLKIKWQYYFLLMTVPWMIYVLFIYWK